jgi:hypothetical protein
VIQGVGAGEPFEVLGCRVVVLAHVTTYGFGGGSTGCGYALRGLEEEQLEFVVIAISEIIVGFPNDVESFATG